MVKRPNNCKLNWNTSKLTSKIQAKYYQKLDELTKNNTSPVSSSLNKDLAKLINTIVDAAKQSVGTQDRKVHLRHNSDDDEVSISAAT